MSMHAFLKGLVKLSAKSEQNAPLSSEDGLWLFLPVKMMGLFPLEMPRTIHIVPSCRDLVLSSVFSFSSENGYSMSSRFSLSFVASSGAASPPEASSKSESCSDS